MISDFHNRNQDRRRCALHPPGFLFIPPKRKSAKKTAAMAWSISCAKFFEESTVRVHGSDRVLFSNEKRGPVLSAPALIS